MIYIHAQNGFKIAIQLLERSKNVHILNRAATEIKETENTFCECHTECITNEMIRSNDCIIGLYQLEQHEHQR